MNLDVPDNVEFGILQLNPSLAINMEFKKIFGIWNLGRVWNLALKFGIWKLCQNLEFGILESCTLKFGMFCAGLILIVYSRCKFTQNGV